MNLDRIANVLTAIVAVAMATTLVSHRGTSDVIKAFGGAFATSLRAAQGR